jgi:hypothetical protein
MFGCKSGGIEYDKSKVDACAFIRKQFTDKRKDRTWIHNVTLTHGDATQLPLIDATHLYSYNWTWGLELLTQMAVVLNKSPFKVLMWTKGPKKTEKCGLLNVELKHKFKVNVSAGQSKVCFIYVKAASP